MRKRIVFTLGRCYIYADFTSTDMKSFHEFSFTEQRQIQELIAAAWAESGELGAEPSESSPPLVDTLSLAELIGPGYTFPSIDGITVDAAERTIGDIARRLARRGVVLHGAKWLGSVEYYCWMVSYLMKYRVRANVAPHRKEVLHYTKLVPNSVDNIFLTLEGFTTELFGLLVVPRSRWLASQAPDKHRMLPGQQRYLTAWQEVFLSTQLSELRPLAVYDLLRGEGIRVKFRIEYSGFYENRQRVEFSGNGFAEMVLEDGVWRIRRMAFPGFSFGQFA